MYRTKYFMTFRSIFSCLFILCLVSRTSSAGIVVKEHSDPDSPQAEDDLNSRINEPSEDKGYSTNKGQKSVTEAENIGKRAPKFAAWGGKRDGSFEQNYELGNLGIKQMAKKLSFSSWGGKRSDVQIKRPSFSSWGGKRAGELVDNGENDKRAKFNAWGGKRSHGFWDEEKRGRFIAWAGKRNYHDDQDPRYKRPQFSPWAGKRSGYNLKDDGLQKRPQFNSWGGKLSRVADGLEEKRAKFSSWGGKRADLEDNSDFEEMKRKFNSWGGKRGKTETSPDLEDPKRDASSSPSAENRIDLDLDKEAPEHSIEKRSVRYLQLPLWKRKFNPWAGERSIRPSNEEWLEQIKRNFNPWGGKRASFSAWGGKRALRTEDDDDADDRRELLRYTLKRQSFRPWWEEINDDLIGTF